MENPKYRVLGEPGEQAFVGSQLLFAGAVIEHLGWLKKDLHKVEAANDIAAQIYAYEKLGGGWALPATPFDASGDLYLPGPTGGGDRVLWGTTDAEGEEVPRYRVVPYDLEVGPPARTVVRGSVIGFLGWPDDRLAAENETAERVAAYFQRHRRQPELPKSPWNSADGGSLYLPPLPDPRPLAEPVKRATPLPRPQWQPGDMHPACPTPLTPAQAVLMNG